MVFLGSQQPAKSSRTIQWCNECLMPSSRPRVVFNEQGVCNACTYSKEKQSINWDARRDEFLKLIEPFRSTNGDWDCVVPWSGGKDSSAIAWKLKYEYGLNPLLVTFSPMIPNEVGIQNRDAMVHAGFDHIMFNPNQKVLRRLGKRFFTERGNPKIAWDAGINSVPVKVAMKFNIKLVFYAEHGESEYGGKVLHEESAKIRDFTEVIEHQIGDDPLNWMDAEITENDLQPYLYPTLEQIQNANLTAFYFAYFHKWSMFENYHFIKEKIDFVTHPKGRTTGTFTDFDSLDDKIDALYYYMQFIKFGFGRTVRDASRLIQNGHITREQGLKHAHQYDDEFPQEYIDDVLKYLDLTEKEFHEIVDKHRNPEVWDKVNGEWKLHFPLPDK